MTASPSIRGLRAAVFAVLCVLLAAGGHALATATAPPLWAQAAGSVAVFGAAYRLGGRERSLPAIGIGTLTAQGALHALFGWAAPGSMGGPSDAGTGPGMRMRMPGMSMRPTGLSSRGLSVRPTGLPSRGMSGASLRSMVGSMRGAHGGHPLAHHASHPHLWSVHGPASHATAAHLLAAVLLTWWLRRGEAAVWSLLRRAVALVPGLVAWWRAGEWAGRESTAVACRDVDHPEPFRRLLLRHAVRRRGPPAGLSYPP
ncbi:hypothetical protein [Streptomyces sp. NPDC087212]|uniref:hypothetical protein n=1 Tax=Streptomyces sp. NPDC087212 TaxID=3365766 RepID=UPI0038288DAE